MASTPKSSAREPRASVSVVDPVRGTLRCNRCGEMFRAERAGVAPMRGATCPNGCGAAREPREKEAS